MIDRIIERSKTSGRIDDNRESLEKRLVTFRDTSMPVVESYRNKNVCVDIDSTPAAAEVYENVKKALDERLPALKA
jgi:adenylate kinase family enzyme